MKRFWVVAMTMGLCAAVVNAPAKPYAVFHTDAGDFVCELLPDKAPKTVENFVGLAKGTKEWQHPATNEVMKGKPLYDGTKFHRTISGFMIQGGDPLGNGQGGPGYKFDNEDSDLKFDAPGILAMANAGRNTNGCQFFVTVEAKPHLNGGYTIFGKIVSGMDIVLKIANAPNKPGSDKPMNAVTLKNVEIVDALPAKAADTKKADAPTSK